MRLVTFRAHPTAAARLGALAEGYVIDLALLGQAGGVALPDDMLAFIDLGPVAVAQASKLMESYRGAWPVGTALPQENVKLLAPIPRPRKNIFGIGLNYTRFSGVKLDAGTVLGGSVPLTMDRSSFGWAAQLGVDIRLAPQWFLNLDAKYVKIDTDISVKGAGIPVTRLDIDPVLLSVGLGYRF